MKFSIRWALIFGFLGLIWGTHIITTTSSFLTSQEVLQQHAQDIMTNIAELAMEQSQNHLSRAYGATALTKRLLANNVVSSDRRQVGQLEQYFYDQLSTYPHFAGIYIGTPNGDFYDLRRIETKTAGGFRTKIITQQDGRRRTRLIWRDADFKLIDEQLDPDDAYDPRIRPWYKLALKENRIVWTDPYIFFTSQKPGITIAGPCADEDGHIRGIVGVDIEIDQLSTFIAGLKIGKNGRAFMLNRNRDIVAFPDLDKLKYAGLESSTNIRLAKINELDDPLSRQAYRAAGFQHDAAGLIELEGPRFARFEHAGKVYHAMFTPFSSWEWPWIIGVHLPEDDYLGAIKANRRLNMLVTVAISVFAAVLGLLLARGVIRPIAALERETRFLQNNDFNHILNVHTAYKEIQATADSFVGMKTALIHYRERLEDLVKERTTDLVKANDSLRNEIAQRLLVEDALRVSEEKYRTILETIEEGYFEIDLAGNFTFINDSLSRIMGREREQLLGLNNRAYTSPQSAQKAFKVFNEIYRTAKPALISHYTILREDRSKRVLELSAALRYDGDGQVVGFRGLARDITARIQAEHAKQKLEGQLQQAQRMKAVGTLAGGIAHDFNNLLMGIQGNLSLLLLSASKQDPQHEYLTAIERCVDSGANLTRQLLGYARGGKYVVTRIDLNETVQRTIGLFSRTKKEINIRTQYQEKLWSVEADQGQMDQVMVNLYLNAWQAMTTDRDIVLTTKNVILEESFTRPYDVKAGRYVMVAVQDSGVGMDAATRERIYEPFFTTKEMGIGTGLGLASVFGIIKNHDGIIDVESRVGQGSTFYIYLPASGKALPSPKPMSDFALVPGSETVLVVDDEEYILRSLKAMLEELGYSVMTAAGGIAAVEMYRAHQDEIDLVMLDMIMPDMGGQEVFGRVKAIKQDVKIILSSGYSLDTLAESVLSNGGDGFIQKPIDMARLSQMLRDVLDQS